MVFDEKGSNSRASQQKKVLCRGVVEVVVERKKV
jgi:hypothetical protein